MSVRPILIWGDPVLHTPAAPVERFDDELARLVADMHETMDAAPGVGLAAPQIGVPLRVFVWHYPDQEEGPARGVAVNPRLWQSPLGIDELDAETESEGCLSFPGERFPLRRADAVLLQAQDLEGAPFELRATGWFARIFQHEHDHLDGVLYVDRLHPDFERDAAKIARKRGWGGAGRSWDPTAERLEG